MAINNSKIPLETDVDDIIGDCFFFSIRIVSLSVGKP